ncbi:hypothetical protein Q2T42_25780 [Leptolyngbya boryana CZ1]|uniref:Uncharacterized protein n=1 Tax=Leptolyngbya boryana CZ1 TaxID=3060204 RepID=A0AA96WT17_LEPBY|nr:hypothetical protein [Leptolyngbya boryana]WNZ45201.1 hypothetical protein Q2T42_25780 [Leptolyngbya boryana CZ1]
MFKFKRKPHLPPAQRLWKQFCEYEKDSAKESEFRCIAGICARQELLEAMCADIGLNAPNICAISYITLFNLPSPNMSIDDRVNFAQFRKHLRSTFLSTWEEFNVRTVQSNR